jgi:hypothetical protein
MHKSRSLAVFASAALLAGAAAVSAAGSASAVAPTVPKVVTVTPGANDAYDVQFVAQPPTGTTDLGSTPTANLLWTDTTGTTSVWSVGGALQQVWLVHGGAIEATWSISGQPYKIAVTPDGLWMALAIDRSAVWSGYVVNATDGTVVASNKTMNPALLDIMLNDPSGGTGNPNLFEIARTTSSPTIYEYNVSTWVPGFAGSLAGFTTAASSAASAVWDAVSPDGTAFVGMFKVTGSPTYESYYAAAGGTSAGDEGPSPSGSVGGFGTDGTLYVAWPNAGASSGVITVYTDPSTFNTAGSQTSTSFIGAVRGFVTASSFSTSVTPPATLASTAAATMRWTGVSWVQPVSHIAKITTSIELAPFATGPSWPGKFFADAGTTHLFYSYDDRNWTEFNWPGNSFKLTQTVIFRSWYGFENPPGHIGDTISGLASSSSAVVYTAKVSLLIYYHSVGVLSGVATVPNGTTIVVQRKLKGSTAWTSYYTRAPVTNYDYAVHIPTSAASWRIVAAGTPQYLGGYSNPLAVP